MTDPLLESHGPPPRVGNLATDVLCVRCGYNLRLLDAEGNCPECNTPVRYSLQGDVLQFADAHWVRSVHRGSWLVYAGILGLLLFILLGLAFMMVVAGWMERVDRYEDVIAVAGQLITWGCLLALLFGVWLLTRQEPRVELIERVVSRRRVARSALVVAAVMFVASATLPPPAAEIGRAMVAILIGIGLWACLRVTAELAARIPDPALNREAHRRSRTLLWTGGLFLAMWLINVCAVTAGPGPSPLRTAGTFLGPWLSCFGVVVVVVVISALSTLSRLRVALRAVLKTGTGRASGADSEDSS